MVKPASRTEYQLTANEISCLQFVKDAGKAYQKDSVPNSSGKVVPSRHVAERLCARAPALLAKRAGSMPVDSANTEVSHDSYTYYEITPDGVEALEEFAQLAIEGCLSELSESAVAALKDLRFSRNTLNDVLLSLKIEREGREGPKERHHQEGTRPGASARQPDHMRERGRQIVDEDNKVLVYSDLLQLAGIGPGDAYEIAVEGPGRIIIQKKISAEELDQMFDEGKEDVIPHFDVGKAERPNIQTKTWEAFFDLVEATDVPADFMESRSDIPYIISLCLVVFQNRERATQWFNGPNPRLDGRAPAKVIFEEGGCQKVKEILGRIDSGYFA